MKNYKIAVAGTGYVGLSLSVLLAQHNQVTAVDIVQAKVDMINNHRSPIQDDYTENCPNTDSESDSCTMKVTNLNQFDLGFKARSDCIIAAPR